jgi:short-subunit dehydrogenase
MKRKAWVIGASTGIGAAVADELNAKGWDVVRSSRSQGDIRIDISSDASVVDSANKYQEAHGNFDLVLVMAGFWQRMSAKQFDLESFQRTR